MSRYLSWRKLGDGSVDVKISKAQRREPSRSGEQLSKQVESCDVAMVAVYAMSGYSHAGIGAFFGLHCAIIGKIVRQAKGRTST